MVRCSAPNCKNNSSKCKRNDEGNKITYHMFPHGIPALCKKWVDTLKEAGKDKNWTPSAYSKLCCVHFDKKFINHSLSQTVLAVDAVPTIFTPSKSPKLKQSISVSGASKSEGEPLLDSTISNCATFGSSESQTVSTVPDLSEELYIINLLTETQDLNLNSAVTHHMASNDQKAQISKSNQSEQFESYEKGPTCEKKDTLKKEDGKETPNANAGMASSTCVQYCPGLRVSYDFDIVLYGRGELAIDIPDDSINRLTVPHQEDSEQLLRIASTTSHQKTVTLETEAGLQLVVHGAETSPATIPTPESKHVQPCSDGDNKMVVGGTQPFVADNEGLKRGTDCEQDKSESLLDILTIIKKQKSNVETEITTTTHNNNNNNNNQQEGTNKSTFYSKIVMGDLIEALAQAELGSCNLGDGYNMNLLPAENDANMPDVTTSSDAEPEQDLTYEEAAALADHFDSSLANFFMLEKAEAAMPRLEAMIDSFMYFYGLTEEHLGYVLNDSPASFVAGHSTEAAALSNMSNESTDMETDTPDETENHNVEDMDLSDDSQLSSIVMVETPQGFTQLMDMDTILEQQDIEQFIDTLNI